MSDSSQSSDDESSSDRSITRRTVLNGAVGTGALALGVGGVAANGKGGQAFVANEEFDSDGTFEIVSGPFESQKDRKRFSCGNQGPGVSFPYWRFKYDGENYEDVPNEELPRLYTRDNTIDTGATYRWTNDKECGSDYRQAGFTSTN